MQDILWEELIPGGNHWSGVLRRGNTLRLTDLESGANVSALFYNKEEKLERYNMPDTLKAQQTAFLTIGNVCYSDMGRIFCSVTADTVGWHDTICGVSDAMYIQKKYGKANFQTHRNGMLRSGKDGLLIELGKWGLGKRDLGPTVNFFSKVTADDYGLLTYQPGNSKTGDIVDLRFEMDTLVVISTSPHPLDPKKEYKPAAIKLTVKKTGDVPADDVCRNHCSQNERGFINTERYYAR